MVFRISACGHCSLSVDTILSWSCDVHRGAGFVTRHCNNPASGVPCTLPGQMLSPWSEQWMVQLNDSKQRSYKTRGIDPETILEIVITFRYTNLLKRLLLPINSAGIPLNCYWHAFMFIFWALGEEFPLPLAHFSSLPGSSIGLPHPFFSTDALILCFLHSRNGSLWASPDHLSLNLVREGSHFAYGSRSWLLFMLPGKIFTLAIVELHMVQPL